MKRHTLSPEQLAYVNAKACYDIIQEQAYALLGECTAETDEEIDAYCEREAAVHTELGTLRARIALRDAEQVLLDWGMARTKNVHPEQAQLLDRLAKTPLLKYRQRAIDLIMRIAA